MIPVRRHGGVGDTRRSTVAWRRGATGCMATASVSRRSRHVYRTSTGPRRRRRFRRGPRATVVAWPDALRELHRRQSAAAARTAAALLSRLRLLPLGRRPGRRDRRSRRGAWSCSTGGKQRTRRAATPAGLGIRCSWRWARRSPSSRFRASRFAICSPPFAKTRRRRRYATFDELLGYCRNSAESGRSAGAVLGPLLRRRRGCELSDAICTGLQLANFWQDVRSRSAKGRTLSAARRMRRFGVDEADLDRPTTSPEFKRAAASRSRPGRRVICVADCRWSS